MSSRRTCLSGGATKSYSAISALPLSLKVPATRVRRVWPVPWPIWHLNRSRAGRGPPATSIPWVSSCTNGSAETVQVWDAVTGGNVITAGESYSVKSISWSPQSDLIAYGSGDATVQIWDRVSQQKIYAYRSHSSPVIAVAWSPTSSSIASASHDS